MLSTVSARRWMYFNILNFRGMPAGKIYDQYLTEDREGIPAETTSRLLSQLFAHSREQVPYYRSIMQDIGNADSVDPTAYLAKLPILTKKIVRDQFDQLKSIDLSARRWYLNTTGGSTGEPVEFIQDRAFAARAGAIKSVFSKFIGCDVGGRQILFWASLSELHGDRDSWKEKLMNWFANTSIQRTNQLKPAAIRDYVSLLNKEKPDLIVGYVWVVNEIARYIENENLHLEKQKAVMTSAGTLHPEIRETIERVFQSKVFNRYGSREVGDIACERPGYDGLWVAPWGNFVEVVDDDGNPVPDGTEGDLLITSLTNYAMPLIRYRIGDRGTMLSSGKTNGNNYQILKTVTGRSIDRFYNRFGNSIESGFFMVLFYHRKWVEKYQVIQKTPSHVNIKLVVNGVKPSDVELNEVIMKSKNIMGDDNCEIELDFVSEIETDPSGKFRFIKSELKRG